MFATKAKDVKYEKKKIREADRQRKMAASGREIGDLPPVVNPQRKALCERNFRLFCERYFPHVFILEWSDDHLETIAIIESTVLTGGLFALAMPRGSGKTSLCEVACVWAALYGHHDFILLIGADSDAATDSLETVRTYLESNELLAQDFPEVCYPISKLEGIQQRRLLYRGKRVKIRFTKFGVVLPDMPGSKAANVIFRVAGITGRIRGMKYTRADKKVVRPTLCLIDDAQTDESAKSQSMTQSRERVVSKAVRGLAGPGRKMAALMPCTVIYKNDMADRMLDRQIHPAWRGRRFKLIYEWPHRMDLWEQYVQIRHECQRADQPTTAATDFYKANYELMRAGHRIAWPSRHADDELDALQNCMNLRYESPEASEEAFQCEYQNEPPELDDGTEKLPTIEHLQKTVIGKYKQRELPQEVAHVFAAVDVQQDLLYWETGGFVPNFTGYSLDYNAFPEQRTNHFTLKSVEDGLQKRYPTANQDGRIYQGLTELVAKLVKTEFKTASGQTARVEKIGIDASFKTQLIHKFCRESDYAAMLYPTHGKGIKAAQLPLRLYKVEVGEKLFQFSMLTKGRTKARTTRHLVIDTNAVKTFLYERFAATTGDAGTFHLYAGHVTKHRMHFEHLQAEYRKRMKHNDRVVEEWAAKPGKPDNHYLDTKGILIALADMAGCKLDIPGARPPKPTRSKRHVETL